MAGVNYEVNIQLNAKTLDKQLGDLEKRVNNLKKNLAAPLRGDESAARRAVATEQKRARLAERRQATQIVTFNLGRKVNELEARGVDVSRIREKLSKAALENDKGRLTMARAQNSVARTLINQEQAKLRISTKAGRMQAESIDALYKARVKRYTLDQQIRRLEEAGVNTTKLRAQLGEATTAQARRQFGSFKQITGELSLAIRKERDKLALQKRQTRELERQQKLGMGVGATSPIGGTPQMVGSPAYKTRQLNLNANWTKFLGDLNDTAQIINATRANNARVNQFKKAQINRNWGLFLDQLNETSRVIKQSAQAGQRKKRNERLQGVALGAGFPLLFGGGPGAILGGAAGGLVGGPAGFAAQIALSAIGQQFDKVAAAAFETGKALTSTGGTLEFMREKSLFSTEAIEDRAIALEEAGEIEKLAALTASDLAKTIGTDGVKALQDLGRETNETAKQWNILTTQLFALVAGPLKEFLKIVNSMLGGITSEQKLGALKRNVTGADLERLNQIEREVRGVQQAGRSKGQLKPLTAAGRTEVLRRAAEAGIVMPTISAPVTGEDRRTITPPKAKKGRRSRLGDFQADLAQAQELFTLEKSIYEARFNDDRRALIRFEKVRELLSIREKEQTVLASDRTEAEKRVQLDALALERKRASLEETYKLAELERTMGQERGKAMLVAIEQQNQLNLGLQQQLQLADSLSQVLGQGLTRSFDLLIDGAQNWGMALRDIAATVLRDIARQLIQIYVIEQAVGFLRTAFGPGPQFGPNYSVDGVGTAGPNFGIPQRARGGAVSANQPYMVGERGPELFVPGASGNIVPNNAMGGSNIVVNVDASGSSVEGRGDDQKRLGEAIGIAVRQELIKQQRPGGLLA